MLLRGKILVHRDLKIERTLHQLKKAAKARKQKIMEGERPHQEYVTPPPPPMRPMRSFANPNMAVVNRGVQAPRVDMFKPPELTGTISKSGMVRYNCYKKTSSEGLRQMILMDTSGPLRKYATPSRSIERRKMPSSLGYSTSKSIEKALSPRSKTYSPSVQEHL